MRVEMKSQTIPLNFPNKDSDDIEKAIKTILIETGLSVYYKCKASVLSGVLTYDKYTEEFIDFAEGENEDLLAP